MSTYYEDFHWEIDVRLEVQFESTSVYLEYFFGNKSSEERFYQALLPKFQVIPEKSLIGEEKLVYVEAQLFDEKGKKEKFFSCRKPVEGIPAQSDCLMPIPWLSDIDYIPPNTFLKLGFHWVEQAPSVVRINNSTRRLKIDHCLPLSKLFAPFKLTGKGAEHNIIPPLEAIKWKISFPEGTKFLQEAEFDKFVPAYKYLRPAFSHVSANLSEIEFSVNPQNNSFNDHTFSLPVELSVPIDLAKAMLDEAINNLKQYTSEVCVAVVDVRGSSAKAEEQRQEPVPPEYLLRFQQLARETFPHIFYQDDPLKLKMKKIIGDMLILVAPANMSCDIVRAVLDFLKKLSDGNFPYRAGFHVDQATDTGNFLYSINDFGTDVLGPAINWAAKVGDDKRNEGIRITDAAADYVRPILDSQFDFISVGSIEKMPDIEIFELQRKQTQPTPTAEQPSSFHFTDRLNERILSVNSRVCVGLDPDLSHFPKSLLNKHQLTESLIVGFTKSSYRDVAKCIIEFNTMVIDLICDHAVAVKPQIAHYERFGPYGMLALEKSVEYAREKNLMIILDAKRNDIGSTAEKYAYAYLGANQEANSAAIPCDALTINPYLGLDGIKPFVDLCKENGKGIFVLVKTSNKSSGDLQDLVLIKDSSNLSFHVASLVNEWGCNIIGEHGYSAVGAVVAATYPEDIKRLRERMPQSFFLIPGYGAQGGTAEDVRNAFDEKGLGAIINSSRGIIYPCPPETEDFQSAIREQVLIMKNDINSVVS